MATVAEVRLWGRTIGAVSLEEGARSAAFEYDPAFRIVPEQHLHVSTIALPFVRPKAILTVKLSGFCLMASAIGCALPVVIHWQSFCF